MDLERIYISTFRFLSNYKGGIMLEKLAGKRTYLTAGLMAVAFFCHKMGWLPKEVLDWVMGLGLPGALAFLRAAK